ncbi:neprilysin-like [Lineus longissimus]|uniref:neprilysin-like n=1 Tax=Lineus longissimus TaxID=88925 RepID=UPI002B4C3349
MASESEDVKPHGGGHGMSTSGKVAIVILTILVICLTVACAILVLLLMDPTVLEGIGIYMDRNHNNGKEPTPAPVLSECKSSKISDFNMTACMEYLQQNIDTIEESGERILQKELKSKCICPKPICPDILTVPTRREPCPTAAELCPTQKELTDKDTSENCPLQTCPTLPMTSASPTCPPCPKLTVPKCPTSDELCPTTTEPNATQKPPRPETTSRILWKITGTTKRTPTCPPPITCPVCPTKVREVSTTRTPCPTLRCPECPKLVIHECPIMKCPTCPTTPSPCPTCSTVPTPANLTCPTCPTTPSPCPPVPTPKNLTCLTCPTTPAQAPAPCPTCPTCPTCRTVPTPPELKCPTCPTNPPPVPSSEQKSTASTSMPITASSTASASETSSPATLSTTLDKPLQINVSHSCPTAAELCPTQSSVASGAENVNDYNDMDNYDQSGDAILDIDEVCTLPTCLSDAGRILSGMDAPTDPCENFHKFSCGGWQVPRSAGKRNLDAIDSYFEEIEKDNVEDIRKVLEVQVERKTTKSAERKVKEYYGSCVSRRERVVDQLLSLKHGLKKLGGWIRKVDKIDFSDWNPRKYDLKASMRAAHFELMSKPFVEVDVHSDLGLNGHPVAHLVISAYDVKPCSEYGKEFRGYLRELAKALNPDSYVETFVQGVSYVYSELCKVNRLEIEAYERLASALELAMPLSYLNETVSWIDWMSFLQPTYSVDWSSTVFLSPGTLLKLQLVGDIMPRLLERNVRDYMAYKYIDDNMLAMPRTIQDVFIKYNKGSTQQRKCGLDLQKGSYTCYHIPIERSWRNCIQFPLQEDMALAVTAEVDGQVNALGNKELIKIRDFIKNFVAHRTSTLPWLAEALQHKFETQIQSIMSTLAEPKWAKNHNKLDSYYEKLSINQSEPFLSNYLRSRKFTQGLKSLYLEAPTKDKFRNLRHSFLLNIRKNQTRLIVDAPIVTMRQPLYKARGLEYLNYGGIGHIISYEFGQAVYAMSDRLMAENIKDEFNCLSKYANISGMTKRDEVLTGVMLDILGVNWAFEAYQSAAKLGDAKAQFLPGVPYTPDQVFFINTAQVWCTIDGKNAEARVNNIMSETPHFITSFQCPAESRLNTGRSCGIR